MQKINDDSYRIRYLKSRKSIINSLGFKWNKLFTISILILSLSELDAQQSVPSMCCPPANYWNFNILANLCSNYAPRCGEVEVSQSGCYGCVAGEGYEPTCCNIWQTHGTPSIQDRSGRWVVKLWFDNTGGEGVKLPVCDIHPACYDLSIDFIKTHDQTYDNNLVIYAVNNLYLPENLPTNDPTGSECYEDPPNVPANAKVLIGNIDLSAYPNINTQYNTVKFRFATNPDVIAPLNPNSSVNGFSLWFYSTHSGFSSQGAVGIDEIKLTKVHEQICEENLVITEANIPVQGEYTAANAIHISGNTTYVIQHADFIAGNKVEVLPKVLLNPSDNYILLEILDICEPCDIIHPINDPMEESNVVSEFDNNTGNIGDFIGYSKNIEHIEYQIIDLYQGVIKVVNDIDMENAKNSLQEEFSYLPKNRLYVIAKIVNGKLVQTFKYVNSFSY